MLRMSNLVAAGFVMAGLAVLGGCETTLGYRQEMDAWTGRTGDDLVIAWGAPVARERLSDGRAVWIYDRETVNHQEGYWRTERRERRETVVVDGVKQERVISVDTPVWQPPQTTVTRCETRFVMTQDVRVQQVVFEGGGCVAPERRQ
jgi:hypothetical protein